MEPKGEEKGFEYVLQESETGHIPQENSIEKGSRKAGGLGFGWVSSGYNIGPKISHYPPMILNLKHILCVWSLHPSILL
jgi:hypothetical protein